MLDNILRHEAKSSCIGNVVVQKDTLKKMATERKIILRIKKRQLKVLGNKMMKEPITLSRHIKNKRDRGKQ